MEHVLGVEIKATILISARNITPWPVGCLLLLRETPRIDKSFLKARARGLIPLKKSRNDSKIKVEVNFIRTFDVSCRDWKCVLTPRLLYLDSDRTAYKFPPTC